MAGLSSLLNTARDALAAQSFGLGVTGQNVANVNTPGYVRRDPILETRALGIQSSGSVTVSGLRRATDVFIERRQFSAVGLSSAASEHDQQLSGVENYFSDYDGGGIRGALDGLFSSFSALAANPTNTTVRSGVLDAAQQFVTRVQDTANALATRKEDLLSQARQTATEVSEKAQTIAQLNMQIAMAQAQGEEPADLLDKRNQVLLDMSGLIDVRTFTNGAGSLVVQASGATLVDGGEARAISIGLDSNSKIQVFASRSGGAPTEVTQFLTGGKLAGIKEARDVDIFDVAQKLDEFVFDVGTAINTQHALGFGSDGVTGRNIFDLPGTATDAARTVTLDAAVAGQPANVAAAGSLLTLPGGSDNAAAMAALFEQTFASGGTRTAAQALGDLVGNVAQRKSNAQQSLEMRQAIETQITEMHEAMSGVSLDEEMVALTKYQRAYQAASRLISTVDELFGDLMQIKR